ncbi:MAG: cysteine desulfurase CsdA, partial [Pseudopedobacter saltans]
MIETAWDIETIRKEFPILNEKVYGKPLVYLDNAATTQKPLSVLKKLEEYYEKYNSNVHRGVHLLSQEATEMYEIARRKIAAFINAPSDKEVIFTKGTTDGINLVANCFGRRFLKEGDVVLVSAMEHHSNIVPWQIT